MVNCLTVIKLEMKHVYSNLYSTQQMHLNIAKLCPLWFRWWKYYMNMLICALKYVCYLTWNILNKWSYVKIVSNVITWSLDKSVIATIIIPHIHSRIVIIFDSVYFCGNVNKINNLNILLQTYKTWPL